MVGPIHKTQQTQELHQMIAGAEAIKSTVPNRLGAASTMANKLDHLAAFSPSLNDRITSGTGDSDNDQIQGCADPSIRNNGLNARRTVANPKRKYEQGGHQPSSGHQPPSKKTKNH